MTGPLVAGLDNVVEALKSVGVHATTDARNLAMPCAWVTVADVTGTLGDCLTVRAKVCLMVGDFGTPITLAQLDTMLEKAASVLTFDEPVTPQMVTPPGVAPMPALVITTSTD